MKTKTMRGSSLTGCRNEGNERERERETEGGRTQFISAFDGVEEVRQGCVSRIIAGTVLYATVAQLQNVFLVSN
jgi:hypothetical protein